MFEIGFCYLCKPFQKSEVVVEGGITEIRISIGMGYWFGDWVLGLWRELWISGNWVGFYWWEWLWESWGGGIWRILVEWKGGIGDLGRLFFG